MNVSTIHTTDKDVLCFVFLLDPGKFNFTPRLFHLSAQSEMFKGVELISPSHVNGVVTAMPFLQDKLYDVPHPGESKQVRTTPQTQMHKHIQTVRRISVVTC